MLNGYISHNFYRKFQHRRAKRCSGGICLYYKECIQDGISIVKNNLNTTVWVKLDAKYFNFESDVFLCGTYLWCRESPLYNTFNVDLFEILESDIVFFFFFKNLGSVYLCGDFNSRFGQKRDFVVFDCIDFNADSDNYNPDLHLDRTSKDNKCNDFGIKLLDLCKAHGLRLVNGRLSDDQNIAILF